MTIPIEDVAVGMAFVAPSGDLLKVNSQFAKFLGYAPSALEQMSFQDVTFAADLAEDVERLGSLLSGNSDSYTMKKRYLTAAGDVVWARLSVRAQRCEEGEVVRLVSTIIDIDADKRHTDRLESWAETDALTGLLRRGPFEHEAGEMLTRAANTGKKLSYFTADLDGLKQINDTYGHAAGDMALRAAAQRLSAASGSGALVARTGGDEFAIVADASAFEQLPRKVDRAVRRPVRAEGRELAVSLSLGASLFPIDGKCLNTLQESADARMYEVKRSRSANRC